VGGTIFQEGHFPSDGWSSTSKSSAAVERVSLLLLGALWGWGTTQAHKKGIRRATVNTFGYIAKAIGPQDVLATLLNNLKVQERQNRVCTTVAIAIVAETCSPFTVLPALMNGVSALPLSIVPFAEALSPLPPGAASLLKVPPDVRATPSTVLPALTNEPVPAPLHPIPSPSPPPPRPLAPSFCNSLLKEPWAIASVPILPLQVPRPGAERAETGSQSRCPFCLKYIGEMGRDYIYAVTPLLEDALMDRDLVHRQVGTPL